MGKIAIYSLIARRIQNVLFSVRVHQKHIEKKGELKIILKTG